MQKLTSVPEVEFEPVEHRYFRGGVEYLSQSKFVHIFEPGFDPAVTAACAKKNGITVAEQRAIWDQKKNHAANHGTNLHRVLEDYFCGKPIDPKYFDMCEQVKCLIQPSRVVFPEKIFYSDECLIAGTADLPSERAVQKDGRQVLDIFDYKTNVSKGITLYTSQLKEGSWRHYPNQRFLKPIDHLEDTLYNKYSLQLSIYMYMAEVAYRAIPGRMGLLYIDSQLDVRILPVPYLRYEVIEMFKYYKQLKTV